MERSVRDAIAATVVTALLVAVAVATSSIELLHWFLLPILLCGALIGPDVVAWLRGRLDLFDPIGVVGAYGYYFFVVAPLFTAATDYHTRGLPVPPDWLSWLGWASVLNALGLIVYRVSRAVLLRNRSARRLWRIDRRRLLRASVVALPVALAFEANILARFGGVAGFIDAFSEGNRDAFAGMGWQFLVADAFPVLLAVVVLVTSRRRLRAVHWSRLALFALGFFALRLIFGGMGGSRSNTVWALFWLAGAIHVWVRPLRWRTVLVACAALMAFMYLYGFYKSFGRAAFDTIQSVGDVREAETASGRTLSATLFGDLARSEVQAVLLYRTVRGDYEPALGSTYLESIMLIAPRQLLPWQPPGKVEKGTEALYGRGSYVPGRWQASQVYGLAGEVLLNFSALVVPFAFALLGWAVAVARNHWASLHADDVRRLLHPLWVNGCIVLLVGDSGNVVVFLLKNAAIPVLFIWAASRSSRPGAAPAGG